MQPALALLEFASIAIGIRAGDAMAKRVPLETLALGTVQPGKFLIAAGGEVAHVEEAWASGCEVGREVGREVGADALLGEIFLPDVHPAIVAALAAPTRVFEGDALGVLETSTVAATLHASDRALKRTSVALEEFRLADGLGGKGYALFSGDVGEVQAAVEIAADGVRAEELVQRVVIPQLHADVARGLSASPEFASHWQPTAAKPRGKTTKTKRKPTRRTKR